tara:strand:- start:84 stop:1136 length:1053 start_codon:yes stop_codon:yes gene_type:complete
MDTFKQINDSLGNIVYGDIPTEIQYLTTEIKDKSIKKEIKLNKKKHKARLGYETNSNGTIYIITTETKYVNSSKLFNELIKMSIISLDTIISFNKKIALNQNEYVQDLIHNLTSLNAYNIQDLDALIPQQNLSKNINTQKNIIKSIIQEKPNITVETLLRLIKYNFAMKVEFSVFEKTVMKNPNVQKIEYSIREIILSILQIFIEDFEAKKIEVSVDSNFTRLFVDYDILFVSLYYIFDNAVKYCSNKTKFKIIFKEDGNDFFVLFDMVSLRIEDFEVGKLCQKKFRAQSAKLLTGEGKGIGMNRVLKTLKLNNAEILIKPRVTEYIKTSGKLNYEHNQFILKFDSTRIL